MRKNVWLYGDGNTTHIYPKLRTLAAGSDFEIVDKRRPSHGAMHLSKFVHQDLPLGLGRLNWPDHVVIGYNGGAEAWIGIGVVDEGVPDEWRAFSLANLRYAIYRFNQLHARVHLVRGPGISHGIWGNRKEQQVDTFLDGLVNEAIEGMAHVGVIDWTLKRNDRTLFQPHPDPHISVLGAHEIAERTFRYLETLR